MFLDRVVNMVDEGVDVAIRIGELPDSTMQAIRVGQVRRVVCASPAYLKAQGIPLTPRRLAPARHRLSQQRHAQPGVAHGGRPVRPAPSACRRA